MAASKGHQSNHETVAVDGDNEWSFDVTCVVGTVRVSPYGKGSPTVAAFALIAEHDAPGVYSFPRADGVCRVTVEHQVD